MNIIKQKLRALVHRRLLPRWLQRKVWNHEYAIAQWDSPNRHDPIYDLLAKYCANRDIFDIGSGQGNTIIEMAPVYRTYTGVDISDAALNIAAQRAAKAGRPRVRFVQGFMHSYRPDHAPDVFLFCESLMYVSRRRSQRTKNVAPFLQRYAAMLAQNGIMIVRLCTSSPDEELYALQVETVVRQKFDVIECRRNQEPAALLLVFQPFRT